MAAERPGFAKLLDQVRGGDTVCVYAVDRLGRDAIDVQSTVKRLIESGVILDVRGVRVLAGDTAKPSSSLSWPNWRRWSGQKIRERTQGGRDGRRRGPHWLRRGARTGARKVWAGRRRGTERRLSLGGGRTGQALPRRRSTSAFQDQRR